MLTAQSTVLFAEVDAKKPRNADSYRTIDRIYTDTMWIVSSARRNKKQGSITSIQSILFSD